MRDIVSKLIKLGDDEPSLRDHIRPIVKSIRSQNQKLASADQALSQIEEMDGYQVYEGDFIEITKVDEDRRPVTNHAIINYGYVKKLEYALVSKDASRELVDILKSNLPTYERPLNSAVHWEHGSNSLASEMKDAFGGVDVMDTVMWITSDRYHDHFAGVYHKDGLLHPIAGEDSLKSPTEYTLTENNVAAFVRRLKRALDHVIENYGITDVYWDLDKGIKKFFNGREFSRLKNKVVNEDDINFFEVNHIEDGMVQFKGRWSPSVLEKDLYSQTEEQRSEARQKGEAIAEGIFEGVSNPKIKDRLEDIEYIDADKNYFYIELTYEEQEKDPKEFLIKNIKNVL